ncbi:hypothetical protein [Solirubrobacter ginsenosidimutans]|uniref:hypothetical protein n=1 Tax=Solirubrobacter ginsenosidimutans TaxID=490573 RepID=UPI0035571B57
MATALNPFIGYDRGAAIVKDATKIGRTLRASPASMRRPWTPPGPPHHRGPGNKAARTPCRV